MKKLLLSLGLILAITLSANAQRPRHHAPARYHNNIGEVRMHVIGELGLYDVGNIFYHEYPRHYSIGAMAESQLGRMLSIGLGAEYYGTRGIYTNNAYRPYLNSVPVYGNLRLSTPGWDARCFIEGRAGYAFPIGSVSVSGTHYAARGFFTGAGIGITLYGSNISVGVNTIDVNNGFGENNHRDVVTDVYLRYSYAIPLY